MTFCARKREPMLERVRESFCRSCARVVRDERGAAYTETLIALPVVLVFFLGLFQLGYVCTADLIVQRAAGAAVRAAVVFLPDDPSFYADNLPTTREAYVKEAARRVLLASPMFDPGALSVSILGTRSGISTITTRVKTAFDCSTFLVKFLCGADHHVTLEAEARLPYQQPGATAP
jgi:Flp pilus assembly protein TadG